MIASDPNGNSFNQEISLASGGVQDNKIITIRREPEGPIRIDHIVY